MSKNRSIPRQLGSLTPILTLLMMALVIALKPASANPVLYPGLWVDLTPPSAQVGPAYGLNIFTGGMALDSGNSSNVYFCRSGFNPVTFQPTGGGIFKSTDAGATWTDLSQLDSAVRLRIDPNNGNHMYATDGVRGNTMGFWISNDGGNTWTTPAGFTTMSNNLANQGYPGMGDGYSVAVEPGNFNHLLVSCHGSYGTIGESTDGGTTWTSHITPAATFSGGYFVAFLYSPNHAVGNAQTWLFCTQTDGMYRTTNSGATWTRQPVSMPHGGFQLYYNSAGVLFGSSVQGPCKSTDNGVTWQYPASGWTTNVQSVGIIGDGSLLYAGEFTHLGGWHTSPESDGVNWTQYNGGSTSAITGPLEMAFDSTNRIIYASNSDIGLSSQMNGFYALKLPNAGAPTSLLGLNAVSSNAQVALSWTASSGATSYNILRSTTLSPNGTGAWTGYSQIANVSTTSYTNTGLTNNTTYYYIVQAVNASGVFSCQTYGIPASAPPPAPTGFTATPGNADVQLAWTPTPTATSYNVLCSTVSGSGYVTVASGLKFEGVQTTSYLDFLATPGSYLVNGTTYYFVITATNSAGTSGNSSQASATPSSGLPSAPTGLTATPGNAQVALSWTASSGATSYNVLRSTVNGSGYASVTTGVATTSYTNTGLTNGTTYYFVITATNSSGTSGNSNQASATPAAGPPPAPTSLAATPGNAQVSLTWSASSGATGYNVLRSTVSGSGYASVATGIAVTNYTNTGLTNGTTYYFVVTATNANGTSGNSNQASATPTSVVGSIISVDFVGGISGSPLPMGSGESAGVVPATNWNDVVPASGSGVALNYSTGSASGATLAWTATSVWGTGITDTPGNNRMMAGYLDNTTGTNSTLTVSGLPSAMTSNGYDVYVYSDVSGGLQTDNYTIGGTTITAIHPFNVNFSGTFIQANNSNGNYVEFTNMSAASFTLTAAAASGSNRAPINGIQIVAHTGGGIPAAPTGLIATPGNAQVALSWTASAGATSYNVLRSIVNGSGYASVATGIAPTNYTNTGLTNGTTYYFVVTATNAGGTSGNSNQASATPQVAAPAAPTGLTATPGNTQIALSWTASTGATTYNALRSTVSGSGYASVATGIATTTYTNTGLTNGTTYYFVVTATNSAGTSGNSNQASATPTASTGGIISIDFVGGYSGSPLSMGSAESAGVVAATNWNNIVPASGSGVALNYSTGSGSGATLTWSASGVWGTGITDTPGNNRMMAGYLDNATGVNTTVTVSSLPSAITTNGYDVYVYSDVSGGLQTDNYTIGGTTITAIHPFNVNFSGTFIQANNSNGNYVKFTGLNGASFTVTAAAASGSTRAPINGIQIVGH